MQIGSGASIRDRAKAVAGSKGTTSQLRRMLSSDCCMPVGERAVRWVTWNHFFVPIAGGSYWALANAPVRAAKEPVSVPSKSLDRNLFPILGRVAFHILVSIRGKGLRELLHQI